jgi:hypothetical protein
MTHHTGMRRLVSAAFLACLLSFAAGCGTATGSVEGSVTSRSKGKKVIWGTVTITGSDNISRTGVITKEGTYVVNGVATGEATVAVLSDDPKPATPRPRPGARGNVPGEDKKPVATDPAGGPAADVPDEIAKGWFPIKNER